MTRCHKTAVEKWAVLLSQRKLLRESEEIDRIERKAASRELYLLTLGILWENSDWSKPSSNVHILVKIVPQVNMYTILT